MLSLVLMASLATSPPPDATLNINDMRDVCLSAQARCESFIKREIDYLELESLDHPDKPLFCATAAQRAGMAGYLKSRIQTNLVAYRYNSAPPAASVVRGAIKAHYPCHKAG